jgi:hypothetical protein
MAVKMQHIYLVFSCKTPDCPAVYKADYLGPLIPNQTIEIPDCHLNGECALCGTTWPYTPADTRLLVEPNPPLPGQLFPCNRTRE